MDYGLLRSLMVLFWLKKYKYLSNGLNYILVSLQ